MSAAAVPEPAEPRRSGWTTLPVRCVRYPTCRGKHKDLTLRPHGAVRCSRCSCVMYVIVFLPLHIAFVAETSASEMAWLNGQSMSAADVLAFFGTAFPYLPPESDA